MTQPKISVLLPTYNSEATVAQAIRSILGQTFQYFELLILDDGSADSTRTVVQSFNDPRIVFHSLSHRGLAATLNDGLEKARYDIVARMDDDDICHPRRFELQLKKMQTLPENYFVSSWYGIFSENKVLYTIKTPTTSAEIKKGLLLHSYVSHPALMFRKRTLLEFGGYKTGAAGEAFEDYYTWLELKDHIEFAILPKLLVLQRYREGSLSNNLNYKQRMMYSIQEPYYKDLKASFGIIDRNEQLKWKGWREYFFGSKMKAREYWFLMGFRAVLSPRVLMAAIVSFLPEHLYIAFKESRFRYRMIYGVQYFSELNMEARDLLRSYLHGETTQ